MGPGLWRHRNFIDVDMYVTSSITSEHHIEMAVYWVLRRNGVMLNEQPDYVTVRWEQYSKWRSIG